MEISLVFIVSLVTTAAAQTTEIIGGCGDTSYYGPSGVIRSPNYPGEYYDNLNCSYYIYASAGSSLSFFFKSFDTEEGFDFVTISCPTNSSFPPQEYSGNVFPDAVSIPWCSRGLVNLVTDGSIVSIGFSLDYYVSLGGCGNTVYTNSTGYVTSPNYPSDYGYNQNCSNIIWSRYLNSLQFTFQFFHLSSCCSCDWVEIRCIDNSLHGPYKFCGYHSYFYLSIIQCTQFLLWFHSDGSENSPGFKIQYDFLSDTTATHRSTLSPTTTPTPPVCGVIDYYGPSGVIHSPNYPDNYDNNLYCNYSIHVPPQSSFSFFFKALNTEDVYDFVTISCPANSSFTPQNYSGYVLPDPVSIPWCNHGSVNFRTDYSVVSTGFSLDYYVSERGCGNTVYNGSQGYVTSPNYPNDYGHEQSCLNIIWAPQPSTFHLVFQSFSLHNCCSCDWLEISCIDNSDYGPRRYCGYYLENSLDIYACSQVLLWFKSDCSYYAQGFSIHYSVSNDGQRKQKVPSYGKPNEEERIKRKERINREARSSRC